MSTATTHFGGQDDHITQYEFSTDDNRHIDRIRIILLEIAVLMFCMGALLLTCGHYLPGTSGWLTSAAGGLFLALGVVYYHPLIGFKRVTTTSEDDINQMMVAMDNLQTAFRAGSVIVAVLSVLTFALVIVVLI